MRVLARIDMPGGDLLIEGEQPFMTVGANSRHPLEGPWIVVSASGDNAVRHSDDIRAFFAKHAEASAVATRLNMVRAA